MTLRWKIAQWFELLWWKNYLRGKNKQQYLAWKKNYWQGVLQQVADEVTINTTDTIADMGCGPAGVFIALPNNQVTAVDPLLNEYKNRLPFFDTTDYPNTTFITSTLEAFSTTTQYNYVFCMNCINHVHNIEKAFDVVCGLVKRNGYLLLSIDAHNYSAFKHLFRLVPGDILHPHQYNLNEYTQFVTARQLKIAKTVLLKTEFTFSHYLLVAVRVD